MQPTDKELIAAEVLDPDVQHQSSHESEELASAMEEIECLYQEYRSSPDFAQEVGPVKPQELAVLCDACSYYKLNGQPFDVFQRPILMT